MIKKWRDCHQIFISRFLVGWIIKISQLLLWFLSLTTPIPCSLSLLALLIRSRVVAPRSVPLSVDSVVPAVSNAHISVLQMGRGKTPPPPPAASSSASPPPWIELPEDVTVNILERLGAEGKLSAQLVCSTWWKVCKDPAMWRVIDLCNPDSDSRTVKKKYAAMCRHQWIGAGGNWSTSPLTPSAMGS